jgi:3',5'-cyclic AMP phosphodiesterase CpdA
MSVAILQLSDLHVSGGRNLALERTGSIVAAIQPHLPEKSGLFLAVTGDVANIGSRQEYEVALRFLEDLSARLRKIEQHEFLGTAIVPGNHDCDYSFSTQSMDV